MLDVSFITRVACPNNWNTGNLRDCGPSDYWRSQIGKRSNLSSNGPKTARWSEGSRYFSMVNLGRSSPSTVKGWINRCGCGYMKCWLRCESREERGGRRMKRQMVRFYSGGDVQGPRFPFFSPLSKVSTVEGNVELRRRALIAGMAVCRRLSQSTGWECGQNAGSVVSSEYRLGTIEVTGRRG